MTTKETAQSLGQALVELLRQKSDLSDSRIEAAFQAVPRHLFLPGLPLETVYADEAIPIKRDEEGVVLSSSSQPSMMVIMLNQLELQPGDNVLEIGTATGYNAAIMQYIVGEAGSVTSIELDHTLARQAMDNLQRAGVTASRVKVVDGDGALGYAPRASYDRIISTVGIWDVPVHWLQQLKPNGILVAPIWLNGFQVSAAFRRKFDGTLYSDKNIPCGFIQLRGVAAGPPTHKRINSSSLTLIADNLDQIDDVMIHLLISDDHEQAHLGLPLGSGDYWYGLLPYLILHQPDTYFWALYFVGDSQRSYGLEGSGFALITPGSACFVPYNDSGVVHCFGGADAFMALHQIVTDWDSAGRPDVNRLRLRLVPVNSGGPGVKDGKLYRRHSHYLHVWLDTST